MGEIDFVSSPVASKSKKGAATQGTIEYTKGEADPATGKSGGWFALFKPKADEAAKVRQNKLEMIRQYVAVKEASVPANANRLNTGPIKPALASISQVKNPTIKKTLPASSPSVYVPEHKSLAEKLKNILFKKAEFKNEQFGGILATNLISGESVAIFNWRKQMIVLALAILMSLGVVIGAYQFLSLWQDNEVKKIIENTQRFNDLNLKIATEEKGVGDILVFQRKLDVIKRLLDRHVYWTKFFDFLEKNTLNEVVLEGFGGDLSGKYGFNGSAKSFKGLAEQLEALQANPLVVKATSRGGKSSADKNGNGTVGFSFELEVRPELFYQTK